MATKTSCGAALVGATLCTSALAAPHPTHTNVIYSATYKRSTLDAWLPKAATPSPLLVYFHGGGFTGGDKSHLQKQQILSVCLDRGISVASVNYPLLEDASYLEIMAHAAESIRFLKAKSKEWNIDTNQIAVMGVSAGAMIAEYLAYGTDLGVVGCFAQLQPYRSWFLLTSIKKNGPPLILYTWSGPTDEVHHPDNARQFKAHCDRVGVPCQIFGTKNSGLPLLPDGESIENHVVQVIFKNWPRAKGVTDKVTSEIQSNATTMPTNTGGTGPAVKLSWPGERIDKWHGHTRHLITIDGCTAWVVEPIEARPGNSWIWSMEFADSFSDRMGVPQLLAEGFYYLHIQVGNTFGCPAALKHLDAFYGAVTAKGLAPKGTLIGISRGGLYAYNWASQNPEKVICIYGDAPVCDFKSWPGGKGKGSGSPGDWKALIQCYGFKNEAEALAWTKNPVDNLEPLARAKIPLIHVVGDVDDAVPVAENTAIVEERYRALGGKITVLHKPTVGHHPHGLDDAQPVVDLIVGYVEAAGK